MFAVLGHTVFAFAWVLVIASPGALSVGESRAQFTYEGPSSLHGTWAGHCDARGILFPPGLAEVLLTSAGGRVIERTAYVNRTLAVGGKTETASGLREEPSGLPSGPLRIELDSDSLLIAFPSPYPSIRAPSFAVDWKANEVSRSAVAVGDTAPGGHVWIRTGESMAHPDLGFYGPSVRVAVEGVANATGALTLYLRHAKIQSGEQVWPKLPYEVESRNLSTPLATRVSLEVHDVSVPLESTAWTLPAGATLVCVGGRAHGQGEFVADGASGRLASNAGGVEFDHRALSLAGDFVLDENATENGVRAQAAGDIRSASFDFGLAVPVSSPSVPWVAVGAVTLAALLFAVAKFAASAVGFYYSRVGRDRALDNANRDLVYEAVRANPGLDLERLAALTSLHRATIAYHVRVLQRVGLVATVRRGKSVRVLDRGLLNARDLPRIVASHDAGLAFVNSFLSGAERPLKEVAEAAMMRLNLTRRGAYRLVSRAVREGVVVRRTIDGEVRVACGAS